MLILFDLIGGVGGRIKYCRVTPFESVSIIVYFIGVGRFRILGGQGLDMGGAKFLAGTWRRNDVDAT